MAALRRVHVDVPNPVGPFTISLVKGDYCYYHYGVDSVNDKGWGCGYRTLQTMCSWIRLQMEDSKHEPSIRQVQEMLVEMGDKPSSFTGSREWIGTYEVAICIDQMYEVPCKILHCRNIEELRDKTPTLLDHYRLIGCPAMIGGDKDSSSKTVLGVALHESDLFESQLLILDPHFLGVPDVNTLIRDGWIKWRPLKELSETSFYNICLPQFHSEKDV